MEERTSSDHDALMCASCNIPARFQCRQVTNLPHELLGCYYSWAGSQHVPHCDDQILLIGHLIQHLCATLVVHMKTVFEVYVIEYLQNGWYTHV